MHAFHLPYLVINPKIALLIIMLYCLSNETVSLGSNHPKKVLLVNIHGKL